MDQEREDKTLKQKKMSLALKTFIGFGLGIVIGLIFQEKATILKPLGTIFLNMIKMIVVPLVFCSITAGVASLGDLRKLRSIGVKVVGLYALIMMEENGKRLASAIQSFSDVMSKITAIVMEFSPIGVCALLADSVGAYGLKIFGPLGKLILTVYASDVILVFLMYVPMVALLARFPIAQFFKGIWKVWVVTLSTTSSAGSLPITTSVTNDDFGVSPELSSFSLPLGATINMNGGCIYYAAAIVMTAQIYGMELTPAALVNIVISTVLVAMGCPGVPGGAIIMTTILLTNMGLPLEIVGMIAGIFRLIDMANTTFNVTGDVVTTMVVARSENMIQSPVPSGKN